MTTQNTVATFEVGKNYSMSFIGDSDLKPVFTCTKRTATRATFQDVRDGETLTRKINCYGDSEYVLEGNYSMAPSISAKRIIQL